MQRGKRCPSLTRIALLIATLTACSARRDTAMNNDSKTIIDVKSPDSVQWFVINDGVMGGLSEGTIETTADGTAVFQGVLSLENNGGFSSVRTRPADFNLAGAEGLIFRVKGDGKRYKAYLRMDSNFDGIIYQAAFETVPGKWMDARLPFKSFEPTYHGRSRPDARPLDANDVTSLGFIVSDKQEGPFRLEIESVKSF